LSLRVTRVAQRVGEIAGPGDRFARRRAAAS